MAGMLFQFALETLEQRERIGRGARETGQDAVLVQTAHLACVGLHDRVAQGDLAVAGHHHEVAAPD